MSSILTPLILEPGTRLMSQDDLRAQLEQHHSAAFGWSLGCSRWDRDAAADVLQASYLKVLDGRARFSGHASFRTWLFGVIRRTAAEHRRRAWLAEVFGWRWLLGRDVSAERSPADDMVRSELDARVRRALSRLSSRQREVLHLVFYQDLSLTEAAATLGISVGSARRHYERGKNRLRSLLQGLNDEPNERSRSARPVPAA